VCTRMCIEAAARESGGGVKLVCDLWVFHKEGRKKHTHTHRKERSFQHYREVLYIQNREKKKGKVVPVVKTKTNKKNSDTQPPPPPLPQKKKKKER
jgi:hypothetical protein